MAHVVLKGQKARPEKRDYRVVKQLQYVTVIWDREWEEYQVGFRDIPVGLWGKEVYHTDDKQDALDTAEVMNNARQEALR